jgi:hypothetical protein
MNSDDPLLTREQMKQFEVDIKEPYKEHESERRRGIEINAGFFEKITALSAGSMAVCASAILAISGKSDIHSGSTRMAVHDLILIADFLGASFLLAIFHNFLAAQVAKLDVAISESQFQWILFTRAASLAQMTTSPTNDETMTQVEDAVREQMSPKQSRRVKCRGSLYLCVNWAGYLSILVFGIAFALVLFYLHQLW